MNTRQVKITLSLALLLTTKGCVGESLGTGGDSGEELSPAPTQIDDGEPNSEEQVGGAGAEPESAPAPDVAPQASTATDDPTVVEDRAGCLTFFTAEEGSGSQFEGELQAATSAPRTVFLNRRGGRYTPGRNNASNNTSSIPDRVVDVAPYEGTDADWQKIMSCVTEQFADYNLRITDQDPGTAPHLEAVVGDGPQALDLDRGVGGISPFTCGVIERSIVYVFSRNLRGVQSECEVIAHEVGHSLGLEHEYLCEDPMTYLHGCGEKSFQDDAAACGTYSAVACQCGRPTQNTVQKLLANVGAATDTPEPPEPDPTDALPEVAVLSPQSGATLPGNTDLSVVVEASDDEGITDVRLLWEFQGTRVLSCRDAVDPVRCTVVGNRLTFTFPVGTGPRAFTAEAVDTKNQTARSERVTLSLTDETVDAAPVVTISSPADGTLVRRGGRLSIRATATDDSAVREVSLTWQSPSGVQTFRLDNLEGDTYGLDLAVSRAAAAGARTLTISAVDDAGQTGTSAPVTVQVRQ